MCSIKHTIDRIKASKMTQKDISDGADVSTTWLRELVNGNNKNPQTRPLKKVNAFLDKCLEEQVALQG